MEGPANNKGLVPRIFQRAFELFSSDADIKSFEISLQFFELYNEQLQARARAIRNARLPHHRSLTATGRSDPSSGSRIGCSRSATVGDTGLYLR